jgi:hypothetical protein
VELSSPGTCPLSPRLQKSLELLPMIEVTLPEMPPMNDAQKVAFATEVAFASLTKEASKLGLKLDPVMGFVYLPDQAVCQHFKEACKAVVESLRSKESSGVNV